MDSRRIGAVYGALVCDALGGQVEFIRKMPLPDETVDEACLMRGGGFLKLSPGQITDDGELTICLARAIAKDKDAARYYAKWLRSNPIDVGNACRTAFSVGGVRNPTNDQMMIHTNGFVGLHENQSNGALMRATPIAAFFYEELDAVVAAYARDDALLSHPSSVCQDANAAYCVAIANLIRGRTATEAFEAAVAVVRDETVLSWLHHAKTKKTTTEIVATMAPANIGWARWGFTLAFYCMLHETPFEDALRDTIRHGGDTDTNAAIVGGMMGALWGQSAIPRQWLKPVLECTTRPGWLRPASLAKLM